MIKLFKEEMKQQGCLGISFRGGEVGALINAEE